MQIVVENYRRATNNFQQTPIFAQLAVCLQCLFRMYQRLSPEMSNSRHAGSCNENLYSISGHLGHRLLRSAERLTVSRRAHSLGRVSLFSLPLEDVGEEAERSVLPLGGGRGGLLGHPGWHFAVSCGEFCIMQMLERGGMSPLPDTMADAVPGMWADGEPLEVSPR